MDVYHKVCELLCHKNSVDKEIFEFDNCDLILLFRDTYFSTTKAWPLRYIIFWISKV
jgi:hypothetical protein